MSSRGFWELGDVADGRLVQELKVLVESGCRIDARVVAHLAEVDARKLYALAGEPSLFEYCLRRLGLSENQAFYRIVAARAARRFPVIFELLERRELHLTTVALVAKYLTTENHSQLLREVCGMTKARVLVLLATRWPRADAVEEVRRLPAGPRAFAAGPDAALEPLAAQTYRLQVNATEALREKLDLACSLLSHANPSRSIAVVIERALELLIAFLQSRAYGKLRGRDPRPSSGVDVAEIPENEAHGRRRRKHIRSHVRRGLAKRDGLRCTYCAEDGTRCTATSLLQIHHETAWAKGGEDTLDNLRLLCRTHNQLLARLEFGEHVPGGANR